jgi:hypothetical protein
VIAHAREYTRSAVSTVAVLRGFFDGAATPLIPRDKLARMAFSQSADPKSSGTNGEIKISKIPLARAGAHRLLTYCLPKQRRKRHISAKPLI